MKRLPFIICLSALMASCSVDMTEIDSRPCIFPDYTDVTVPQQIAPPSFRIDEDASRFKTEFSIDGASVCKASGKEVRIPKHRWKRMLASADSISVKVSAKAGDGWKTFKAFNIYVTKDPVDRYVSYRLIPPSFQKYEEISISQRDLFSYKEKLIYSNTLVQRGNRGEGQCINCHSFQNWDAGHMQFHARQYKGGTVIIKDGKFQKVNLKTDATISAGVYPAWNPKYDFIAYSTNTTVQEFHTGGTNRIEVFDAESDLVLYDLEKNRITGISCDPEQLECFPAWSPDGRTLYYVSARLALDEMTDPLSWIAAHPDSVRYSIMKRSFDPATKCWSDADTVFDAASMGMSATLPRISPDGRYLMFTMARYGVFHIWHPDADLYILDLESGCIRCLDELNSPHTESYHSWSSNGKWVVFGSRRADETCTRLYFAHIEEDGHFSKPFQLPQASTDYDWERLCSYNIPEFTVNKVKTGPLKIARKIRKSDAIQAN